MLHGLCLVEFLLCCIQIQTLVHKHTTFFLNRSHIVLEEVLDRRQSVLGGVIEKLAFSSAETKLRRANFC